MLEHAQAFLHWTTAHPGWALAILLLVSCVDALFIIGAFIPASIVLFAAGALVALGSLNIWVATFTSATGALIGDGLSFWLGRHYGDRLFEARFIRRYPELIATGRRFFQDHGGKGVMLARFLGPVRAVTPAMAGASAMPIWIFLMADAVSAVIWSLIYLIPGIVFGASLALAAEVAARLAGLLVVSILVIGGAFWLTRIVIAFMQRYAETWLGALLDWSRAHRRLGRFGATLTDPLQPETPALAAVALIIMALGALWLLTFGQSPSPVYPRAIDAFVYQVLRDLQTPWGNTVARHIAQLGDPHVYLPTAAAVFGTLMLRRKFRAAAHWVAALGFGAVISLVLHAIPSLPPPLDYYHGFTGARHFATRDLVMVLVIYGFIPILLSTQRPARVRVRAYTGTAILLLHIVLARLYLGQEWWTLSLFSIVIAVTWLAALGLGYRRHEPERVFTHRFLLPVAAVFIIAALVRWQSAPEWDHGRNVQAPTRTMNADEWKAGGWRLLARQRIDLRGEPGQPFTVQWAGTEDQIGQILQARGWTPPVPLKASNVLLWLTEKPGIEALPLLPLVHAGQHQSFVYTKTDDESHQRVLRFWPSGWELDDGHPIWLGLMTRQQTRERFEVLRMPVPEHQLPHWDPKLPTPVAVRPGPEGPLLLIGG